MPTVEVRAAEFWLEAEVSGIPERRAAEFWLEAEVSGIPERRAAEFWLEIEVWDQPLPAQQGRTTIVWIG